MDWLEDIFLAVLYGAAKVLSNNGLVWAAVLRRRAVLVRIIGDTFSDEIEREGRVLVE